MIRIIACLERGTKSGGLKYLVAVFGREAKTELVAYDDKDWSKVDYNGGCPAGIMQPGCFSYFYHAPREPFGRYASKFLFELCCN